MRILITGGLGFIGSHLAKYYLEAGHEVIIVDNLSTGNISNLPLSYNKLRILFLNINTLSSHSMYQMLRDEFEKGIDYVFHYSACVGVNRTTKNSELVIDDMFGISNLIYLCNTYKVKKFIFASSSEVYGENSNAKEDESKLCNKTPYMITKRYGEKMLEYGGLKDDIEYYILRFFNVYGKNQSSDFLIGKLYDNVLRKDDKFFIYNERATRDFVYIDDNIRATDFIIHEAKPNTIHNICTGESLQIIEVVRLFSKVVGFYFKENYTLQRDDIVMRAGDNTKLLDLGFRFQYNLESGLKKMLSEK